MPSTIEHTIEPVFDKRSRVLMLGSIPSPKSREQGFFYGHPQNRFWRVLAAVFDEPAPRTVADKKDLLLRRGIALWDVAASCEIKGASDASIRNVVPNDLKRILETADIQAVFCTGAKAGQLYARLCKNDLGMPAVTLPSTSPANAKATLPQLTQAYRSALAPYMANGESVPVLNVADVVRLEQEIAKRGTSLALLMERAGRFLAHRARRMAEEAERHEEAQQRRKSAFSEEDLHRKKNVPSEESPCFIVLCGNGNNGGDGWVAARDLAESGQRVIVVCNAAPDSISAQPARDAAQAAKRILENAPHALILTAPTKDRLHEAFSQADVCIDALLGTGFEGSRVRASFDAWIAAANERRAHGMLTVAADVPSGISAQTGKAATPCVKADETVTMIVSKPGLETPFAFAFCGTVSVAPLAYIKPILEEKAGNAPAKHETASTSKRSLDAGKHALDESDEKAAASGKRTAPAEAKRLARVNDEFLRAEAEDDDGYDPYSDRRPEPEPLFQRDPWS